MDAVASGRVFPPDENAVSGRRSRVVPAPRPWRQVGAKYRADDGGKKRRSPGRARISRKTIARGKPGCLGCTCGLTRVLFCATFAHGTAGASSARLSLRPLSERGKTNCKAQAESRRENEPVCFHVIASEATLLRLLRKLRRVQVRRSASARRRKQSTYPRGQRLIALSLSLLAMTVWQQFARAAYVAST